MGAKKIAIYAGIGIIWIAGFGVCYAVGNVTGKAMNRLCSSATTKLLAL